MSLKGFGLFMKLIGNGHDLSAMGLQGRPGDVLRLSNRLRLVKAFQGLNLVGVAPKTAKGYDALVLVFLTHSALEQFLEVTGQKLADIELAHRARRSDELVAEIFDADDRQGKLFDFLHARLNKKLQAKLVECKQKKCCNVGIVSSAIRHIFVHGELTANPTRMKPKRIYRICEKISAFLIDYMDDAFSSRMREYYAARGRDGSACQARTAGRGSRNNDLGD